MKKILVKKGQYGMLPKKHYNGDLGWDLYLPCNVWIEPSQVVLIDLDISIKLPDGYGAFIKDRSSIASKGVHIFAGVIDNEYTGPLKIALYNSNDYVISFDVGDAIAQLVLIPLVNVEMEEVKELPITKRGENGFGSTSEKKYKE